MLEKLQKKWGVSGRSFAMILITFAVTGTTTAWLSKFLTQKLQIDAYSPLFWTIKFFVLIFGYQILILFWGWVFGQFGFFWRYEKKILRKFGIIKNNNPLVRIAVFASGAGSNFNELLKYFSKKSNLSIDLLVCNKPEAKAIEIAKNNNIKVVLVNREKWKQIDELMRTLKDEKIDFIVLAGFLWKIPASLIDAFPNKIVNLHPSLLPKYGGKGMHGIHVHESVIAAGEKESGITIHYVNEAYDDGTIIFQTTCPISPSDTPETLAQKIHRLEHRHFPEQVEAVIKKQMQG